MKFSLFVSKKCPELLIPKNLIMILKSTLIPKLRKGEYEIFDINDAVKEKNEKFFIDETGDIQDVSLIFNVKSRGELALLKEKDNKALIMVIKSLFFNSLRKGTSSKTIFEGTIFSTEISFEKIEQFLETLDMDDVLYPDLKDVFAKIETVYEVISYAEAVSKENKSEPSDSNFIPIRDGENLGGGMPAFSIKNPYLGSENKISGDVFLSEKKFSCQGCSLVECGDGNDYENPFDPASFSQI